MIEQAQIKLIVGLGNPGAEYLKTRHNIGFMVLEKFLAEMPAGRFVESSQASSRIFTGKFRSRELRLQMPLTFMNLSGNAVRIMAGKLKLMPHEILVVSDDLDLPFGRIRLRENGSDGGHNGLKSIISELNASGFKRLRVGIGRPVPHHGAEYVLSEFDEKESESLDDVLKTAVAAIKTVMMCGMSKAMNEFNHKEIICCNNTETKDKQTK
jgi:PTH1 family peptidyl-tRNA hydrolase